MDDVTKDFIQRNSAKLAGLTDFNAPLLLQLFSANVLTGNEVDSIKNKTTKLDKSTEFYMNILPNKVQECYDKTIHALSCRGIEQNAAAHILMELKDQSSLNTESRAQQGTISSVSVMQSMGDDGVHVNIERLVRILREVGDRKFILLSINGKMRHGKSFMMSCILSYLKSNGSAAWIREMVHASQRSAAFSWRNGRDAETKGIHIWPQPLMIRDGNNEEIAVILMDCQGAFDDETSTHQNSLIFAMSTLLSSVLIYNVLDRITEADIQPFLVFMQTALQAGDENRDGDKPFQSLIILNRDVHPENGQLKHGYYTETTTPGNCPRNLFRELFYPPTSVREIRNSREPILNNFNDTALFALPYPGDAIRNDDIANLKREFFTKTNEFINSLFDRNNLELKRIGGGNPITGNEYIPYCRALGETFNRNTIPRVKSFYDAVTEGQLVVAIENVMEEYNSKMNQFTSQNGKGFSAQEVLNENNVIRDETLESFAKRSSVGSPELQVRFRDLLQLEIEVAHQTFQVAEANKRLAALNASDPKYYYNKPFQVKHRTSFMGFNSTPYYTTEYVRTFNEAIFNRDAALAKSEVATAITNLDGAKLARRTFSMRMN